MPKRDIVIMVIAGISGVIVFVIMLGYIKNSKVVPRQPIPLVRCVMAAETILKDQEIKENSVLLSKPVENQNVSDYFISVSDAIGYIAKEDIPKDSLIKRASVAKKPGQTILAAPKKPESLPVPAGLRAMKILTLNIDNIPDSLAVGSYLDLIADTLNAEGRLEPRTIAAATQIISISKQEDGGIQSLTIATRPRNVIEISKALNKGRIRAVVRPESAANLGNLGYIEIIRGITKEKSFQGQELARREQ